MATELTWQDDINHLVGDVSTAGNITKWQGFYLTSMLIGNTVDGVSFADGLWTAVESCYYNGATLTVAPGYNWDNAGSYDSTRIVQGTGGAGDARSWCVLQSPGSLGGASSIYLIVDMLYSNGADFVFSTTLPAGGTTTARPTSSDEVVFSQLVDGQNMALNNANTSINHYTHLMLSGNAVPVATDGAFSFYTSFTGSGTFYSMLSVGQLADTKTGDTQPWVSMFCGGGEAGASISAITNNIFNYGTGGQTGRLRTRNTSNTDSIVVASAYTILLDGSTPRNPLKDTGYTEGVNESDSNYNEWFLPVYAKGPFSQAKGRLIDMRLASGSVLEMAARPAIAPFEYIKFGDSWVPWTGSSSPIV